MMNAEVIKAMNKKEKKEKNFTFYKWWNKNGHKVCRVVFFPVQLIMIAKTKITKWLNSREVWDEKRVDKILNYYIPRRADWDNKDKHFYFFDNGLGWNMKYAKKYLKRKDRRFWNVHKGWGGGNIRSYLIDNFELDGFVKKIGDCNDGWTEITFTMIKK